MRGPELSPGIGSAGIATCGLRTDRERRSTRRRRRTGTDRKRICENVGRCWNFSGNHSPDGRYGVRPRRRSDNGGIPGRIRRERRTRFPFDRRDRAAGAMEIAGESLNVLLPGGIESPRREGAGGIGRERRGVHAADGARQGEEGEHQQKAEQRRPLPAASSVVLFGNGFAQAGISCLVSTVFDTIYRRSAVMPNYSPEKNEKKYFSGRQG